jgi:hypothetical protein
VRLRIPLLTLRNTNSKLKQNHIKDLKRAFTNLRNAGLKLNPKKCIFGVSKGKLLGYLVSARGIKANPKK